MQIERGPQDQIELTVSNDERYLIKQCLNECCHGFRIADFRNAIGADKPLVSRLLDEIDDAVDQTPSGPEDLTIVSDGKKGFKITLSQAQARIFVNCMSETTKALDARDFPSRIGGKFDEVKALFSQIAANLI